MDNKEPRSERQVAWKSGGGVSSGLKSRKRPAKKPDTIIDEPVKVEPVKVETVKSEPKKPEPKKEIANPLEDFDFRKSESAKVQVYPKLTDVPKEPEKSEAAADSVSAPEPRPRRTGSSGKKSKRARKRRQRMIKKILIVAIPVLVLLLVLGLIVKGCGSVLEKRKNNPDKKGNGTQVEETAPESTESPEEIAAREYQEKTEQANLMYAMYDYDGAIELLQTIEGYEEDENIMAVINACEEAKTHLVLVDPKDVTHIFYHSLVVEPSKAFGTDQLSAGFKQWMTTVTEFNRITQKMYENGYVLISLYDIIGETVDENGTTHMYTKELYLPKGKKPFVMSLDDLSYYHSYDNRGIATKLIIGEDGKPTNEYLQDDGSILIGSYDCVPLLNDFLEEHPDGCYKGARGTIALTGYDGILGYRTDIAYKTHENLDKDQEVWLNEHPDFDWDKEREEAQKVAECIKATGWTFASHTWGHQRVGSISFERLVRDTEKWDTYVKPLVGDTDIIIFAHGQDLDGGAKNYLNSEKFKYLKSMGFNIYCDVDSHDYTMEINDLFAHDGRRNLDGYRLWNDAHGISNWTKDLFVASEMLDERRTDMPPL